MPDQDAQEQGQDQGADEQDRAIPLLDEHLVVGKRAVETGRVRVRTEVAEHVEIARADLERQDVDIEHVLIGREVTEVPAVRREGATLIVPVLEEQLVVTKRLILTKEVRITQRCSVEPFEEPVALRTTHAVVERESASDTPAVPSPVSVGE